MYLTLNQGNNSALGAGTIGAIGGTDYVSSNFCSVFTIVERTALDVKSHCELWSVDSD